jgi:hypothetical protein
MRSLSRFALPGRILGLGLMLSSVACSESILSPAPVEPPLLPPVHPEAMMAAVPSVVDARIRILRTLSRQVMVPALEESLVLLERRLEEGAPSHLLRNQVLAAAGALNRYALLAPPWEAPDLTVIRLSLIYTGFLVGLTPLDIQAA